MIGRRRFIDNDERGARAVSGRIPRISVSKIENLFAGAVDDPKALTAIIERAGVLTRDRQTSAVSVGERRNIFHQQHMRAWREIRHGAAREIEEDPIRELYPGEGQGDVGRNVL